MAKPTIEELEAMLESCERPPIEILPNGEVVPVACESGPTDVVDGLARIAGVARNGPSHY